MRVIGGAAMRPPTRAPATCSRSSPDTNCAKLKLVPVTPAAASAPGSATYFVVTAVPPQHGLSGQRLGLDPAEIVDLLDSTALGSPYAVQKARTMLAGDFTPAFALKHALKDADLAAQAAQASGAELSLTDALLPRWRRAAASGHADDDLAAIYTTS